MNIYGEQLSPRQLMERIGNMNQVAGVKRYLLKEGRSEGVDAIDIKTGSGMNFTVLPGRGMDIAWLEYQGKPISYMNKNGIVNATYYSPQGYEWLRSFFGGALTTCGLTHVGPPDQDGIWELGLHGRISNTPAEQVTAENFWDGEDYIMQLSGIMHESVIFGENLMLKRVIQTKLGEKKLILHDTITNEGFIDVPFMILYHMNIGYPVISENSYVYIPTNSIIPRDLEAEKGISNWNTCEKPSKGYAEQVFFHDLKQSTSGNTCVGIINESISFGISIKFNKNELPYFTQWKMMGQQDYVMGFEPGNCIPEGRPTAATRKSLVYLKPGEKKDIWIEIGILDGSTAFQSFLKHINAL